MGGNRILPGALAAVAVAGILCLAWSGSGDSQTGTTLANNAQALRSKTEVSRKAVEESYYRARGGHDVCLSPDYSKQTLKPSLAPRPFAGLFTNLKGQRKFEASDIIRTVRHGRDQFYVVFDNLFSIGRVEANVPIHNDKNALIGTPGVDSGYEAIVYDNISDTFFVTIEATNADGAIALNEGKELSRSYAAPPYVAVVRELNLPTDGTTIEGDIVSCPVAFPFPSANKGFEGMFLHRTGPSHTDLYLIALCEGNYCEGGRRGRTPGNGRMIVLQWMDGKKHEPPSTLKGVSCFWAPVHEIKLPSEINFIDYSAVTVSDSRMAISSQENAAVWVGNVSLAGSDPKGWDVLSGGSTFHFPRDTECRITNCNVEGLAWVGQNTLAAVSDKMKSGGRQDFRCLEADQAFQQWVLP